MVVHSSNEIYEIIEELVKKAGDTPLTCVDVYDDKRVAKLAPNANRVSDYMGHMWRRGLLQRWYTNNPSQRARYGYTWKENHDEQPKKVENLQVVRNTAGRPNVTITEEDRRVVLDFPEFTIIVQSKER